METTRTVAELQRKALAGRLNRREVLRRAAGLGLTAPVIAGLLSSCGGSGESAATATESGSQTTPVGATSSPVATEASSSTSPTAGQGQRGDSGDLNVLMTQAPTILNPHLASGYKDWHSAQFVLEPLADFDTDGNVYPVLAAEIPSQDNGGLAADGTSVTWKLKQGVTWSDGEPFTAGDVKFTYDYLSNPDTAATTAGSYTAVDSVTVVDDTTIKITFKQPTPGWYLMFCGLNGMIVPQHLLKDAVGKNARNAPFNLKPTGTGPYKVDQFKPGDTIQFSLNDKFREPNQPHFQAVNLKGGGDGLSAARAVIQTGEADYAWGAAVPAQLFDSMKDGPTGKLLLTPPPPGVERIAVNQSDPNKSVDGQQSHLGTPHPFQSDLNVRKAYALAVPRDQIAQTVYGPTAKAGVNVLNGPPKFVSKNTTWKFDLDAAGKLLDDAGWVKGSDGIRAKNGVKMEITYQTSTSTQRQQAQEILKANFEQLGLKVTLKVVDPSVFFSASAGNNDTYPHFYADLELYYIGPTAPFPLAYMAQFYGKRENIAQKENQWSGLNITRWQNSDYDAAYEQATVELDPAKQAELFIKMNDLIVNDVAVIPEYVNQGAVPVAHTLAGLQPSPWTGNFARVAEWYRTASSS